MSSWVTTPHQAVASEVATTHLVDAKIWVTTPLTAVVKSGQRDAAALCPVDDNVATLSVKVAKEIS